MVKIVDHRKKWDKLVKDLEPLKKGPVVGIGYPENKVSNSIIAYASYNHFGTRNIPARPFLAVTIDKNKEKIFKLKEKLGAQILSDQIDVNKALGLIGAVVRGMVVETISGPFFKETVPNAPSTIRIKGSSQPLIDHGIMKNATTWEVFPNGKPR